MKILATRKRRTKLPDQYAQPGIYRIQCLANGKFYIGSTGISIRKRWGQHVSALAHGKHSNPNLQASWNKYGEGGFTFGVVEFCDSGVAVCREDYYIKLWSPSFNCAPAANPRLGAKLSPKQRQRLSDIAKARMTSEEIRRLRKMSQNQDKTSQIAAMRRKSRKAVVDQDGFIWGSIGLAARFYNVSDSAVSHNVVGRTKLVRKKYTFTYLKG